MAIPLLEAYRNIFKQALFIDSHCKDLSINSLQAFMEEVFGPAV
jgi:hypothetical protein